MYADSSLEAERTIVNSRRKSEPRTLTLLYLSRVNSDPGWLKNR
jgi:hypothetical protein